MKERDGGLTDILWRIPERPFEELFVGLAAVFKNIKEDCRLPT
jgi:hypothetical protein